MYVRETNLICSLHMGSTQCSQFQLQASLKNMPQGQQIKTEINKKKYPTNPKTKKNKPNGKTM